MKHTHTYRDREIHSNILKHDQTEQQRVNNKIRFYWVDTMIDIVDSIQYTWKNGTIVMKLDVFCSNMCANFYVFSLVSHGQMVKQLIFILNISKVFPNIL